MKKKRSINDWIMRNKFINRFGGKECVGGRPSYQIMMRAMHKFCDKTIFRIGDQI